MTTETQVREILKNPFAEGRVWTIQGLGMLRTHLDADERVRLHIWDTDQAVDDVSTIHDHPWDFDSQVIFGHIRNQKYLAGVRYHGVTMHTAQIRCGMGGGLIGESHLTEVASLIPRIYSSGESYSMEAPELHESFPSQGAVTVITRDFKADRDIATVCWKEGDWVSAEPRIATVAEVMRFVSLARRKIGEDNQHEVKPPQNRGELIERYAPKDFYK